MNFEAIQKANESIKTTNIKGKEYAEVNQRIKAFRMVYPTGYIKTELLSDVDGVCTFRAECGWICGDRKSVLGVGHAQEKETSSYINKTSYIENCETSAVGRALGMAGFGIDTSVASYEEVANAIKNQEREGFEVTKAEDVEKGLKRKELAKQLKTMLIEKNVSAVEFCKENGITKDSTEEELEAAINKAGLL